MRRITLILTLALLFSPASDIYSRQYFEHNIQKPWDSERLSSMPLPFTENRGQWGEKTLFKAEAGGATFYFCRDEVAYMFVRNTGEIEESPYPEMREITDKLYAPRHKKEALLIKAQFVGANPDVKITGESRLPHNCNYFYRNDPNKWCTNVPNFASVVYHDIYPGIDLRYYGDGRSMKYEFIVHPGAKISNIAIRYDGIDNLGVTPGGDLEMRTRFGPVFEKMPYIYQDIDGARRVIDGRYEMKSERDFGFGVDGAYNPNLMLLIDPELIYSTYMGGDNNDGSYDITVDSIGHVFLTGATASPDFPTQNPFQIDQQSWDVFVTKLSPTGDYLIYSTYLGGGDAESGTGIEIDNLGNAYVTGYTYSTDFPLQNPYQWNRPACDVFISKLSPYGDSLIYSTYLGAENDEIGNAIAVDTGNCAYVTGYTISYQFPTLNPFQRNQDGEDAFVTKLMPEGNVLGFSTYLGGNSEDCAYDIAVDRNGSAYVTGTTYSTDFPTENLYQNDQQYADAFVTKLSSAGNALVYSTYLGGNGEDYGRAIEIDNNLGAFVAGHTSSTDFPLSNPFQANQYSWDIFLTNLSPDGDLLLFSTYLGGNDVDCASSIVVDISGNAYLTGFSTSTDFPILNPFQTYAFAEDAIITEFSPSGLPLLYSTYLGGNADDRGYGIAVDNSGNTYVTGATASTNFPLQNPYQTDQGGTDVFITKFGFPVATDDSRELPSQFDLVRIYPNPFNAQTIIEYTLPEAGFVRLQVYDICGRAIAILAEGIKPAGRHRVTWDAKDMPSGLYFARLQTGEFTEIRKITLLK